MNQFKTLKMQVFSQNSANVALLQPTRLQHDIERKKAHVVDKNQHSGKEFVK